MSNVSSVTLTLSGHNYLVSPVYSNLELYIMFKRREGYYQNIGGHVSTFREAAEVCIAHVSRMETPERGTYP